MTTAKPSTSKKSQAKKASDTATLTKADGIDIDTALSGLTGAQTKIARALAEIQEELLARHSELAAVNEAIVLQTTKMTELHGADAMLLSLDELRVKLDAEQAAAERTRSNLTAEAARVQADLDQIRQRDEAEYQYKTAQRHKADADLWAQTKDDRARAEKLRIDEFERDLLQRNAALVAKEATYAEAIARNATFDEQVKAATAREVHTTAAAMKRDYDHKCQIDIVNQQAATSNLQKDIEHNNKTIAALHVELASTKQQLADAIAAQTALAKATVDAAANTKAQADALSLVTNINGGGNGTRPRS